MNLKLQDKKVFITGSSSGIGLEIAKKFHSSGCIVGLNSKNIQSLEKAKKLFDKEMFTILGDMSNKESANKAINTFIDKYNRLDILICNVGSGRSSAPFEENIHDWEKSISLNLFSAINPITASVEHLAKSRGVVTCISSICGDKMIENAPLTYSSAKAALNRYIKNSSFYLGKRNIRINAVSPGNVLFEGSIWQKKLLENKKAILKMIKNKVPLNKFVNTAEIADAVAFLSSPLSSSTTGQILAVDGGQSIG